MRPSQRARLAASKVAGVMNRSPMMAIFVRRRSSALISLPPGVGQGRPIGRELLGERSQPVTPPRGRLNLWRRLAMSMALFSWYALVNGGQHERKKDTI